MSGKVAGAGRVKRNKYVAWGAISEGGDKTRE